MVESNSVYPIVEYSPNLADAPYTVFVDQNLCGQFLSELGMPNEDIEQTLIQVARGSSRSTIGGNYSSEESSVTIYTDWLWTRYLKHLKEIQQLSLHQGKKPSKKFQELFYTKKLPHYLASAPLERSSLFTQKLLTNAVNRRLNNIQRHELGHRLDHVINPIIYEAARKRKRRCLIIGGMAGALFSLTLLSLVSSFTESQGQISFNPTMELFSIIYGIWLGYMYDYTTSEIEWKANNFERRFTNHPQWRSLITITQKD